MSINRMYLCDTFRLIPVCVQIITYFHFPTPHHQLPSCLWQSVLMLCKVRGDGGGMWEIRGLLEKYPTFGREKETGLLGALDT